MNLSGARQYVSSLGYNVYYIAVYGSQNYGLDIYDEDYRSDVDYKCIIIPTLDNLIRNSKPVSMVVYFEGGQIDVKDIRSYVESVVKCNVNFLEILATDHYLCTDEKPMLREYLKPLMEEMGVFYIKACYGMMLEKYEALRHPYPSTVAKIEKFGYDPKQLHHIVRLYILIRRYMDGIFPDFRNEGYEKDFLIKIKKGEIPNNEVDEIVNSYISETKILRDSYSIEPIFLTKERFIEDSYRIIKNHL